MQPQRVLLYDYPGSICCQMVRLTFAEKRVAYERQTIDIIEKEEQFEDWYLALNPKGVVPTLALGDEIVTDTMNICPRIDAEFDGPELTPTEADQREVMERWMVDIMAVRYGVLLYSRQLDADRRAPTIVSRGKWLRELREQRPEHRELFDKRIEGNAKLQATLADASAVEAVVQGIHELIGGLDAALADRPFVAGESYTLADAYATAALARLDQHGHANWWEQGQLPGVAAYYGRVQGRPSWNEAGVVNR